MVINTLKIQMQRYSFRPKTASYSSGFLRLFYINLISTSYKENIQIILLYDILLIKDIYYICNEMHPILGMQKIRAFMRLSSMFQTSQLCNILRRLATEMPIVYMYVHRTLISAWVFMSLILSM